MLNKLKWGTVGMIYIFMAVPMFYFTDTGFFIGSYGIMYYYIFAAGIILMGTMAFLIRADVMRLKILAQDSIVLWIPYLFSLIYSVFIWITEYTGTSTITRGTFFVLYQLIAIITAAATILIFGKYSPWMQLSAMCIAYILHIVRTVAVYGVNTFVTEYINLIRSFGIRTGDATRVLELHTLMFAFGIYLTYIVISRMKWWKKILVLIPVLLLFLVGFKRIVFVGLFCAAIITFILKKIKKEKICLDFLLMAGCAVLIVCMCYNLFVASGLYERVTTYFNIDTKGRLEMYNDTAEWYNISPAFTGHGVGFVSRNLSDADRRGSGALHNDLLVSYIELGFWGFLIWGFLYIIWRSWWFYKFRGRNDAILLIALIFFCLCTYSSDNTYYYFYVNLSFATLIMSYQIEEKEKPCEYVRTEEL